MNTTLRKLPIGMQDFKDLVERDFIYVDKTEYIHKLLLQGKPYFLSRPRRFGKSLFLSTLKYFFQGEKDLFKGLKIYDLEKEWTEYPVFYLDFNFESYKDIASFNAVLDSNIRRIEKQWGKNEAELTFASRFGGLIERAYEKSGNQVVVLIDEYDKPLLNTLDEPDLNDAFRKELKGFYGVLKMMDYALRFVFLTGVTKFSKVSIFSDLNQLRDISMSVDFAGICGISEAELLDTFKPDIEALAHAHNMTYDAAFAELKKRYDGYHFAKESEDIYNPFSVLNSFASKDFGNYWFETGTPTMLARQIRNEKIDARKLENEITANEKMLKDFRPGETSVIPLLYQSGYLTIKKYDSSFNTYTLGFPNEEVRYGFMENLLPVYAPANLYLLDNFFAGDFIRALYGGDVEGFMTQTKAFFASIEYDAIPKEQKNENHFQLVFYIMFKLMGQYVRVEEKSSKGRADAVVWAKNAIYVFEFKMETNATAEDALKQIDAKDYSIPYAADHRKVVKIGVEFSVEEGGVKRWIVG